MNNNNKVQVRFDTIPISLVVDRSGCYSLHIKDRPIYEDNRVFDEVVKEKTLPIDADLLQFAFVSILKTVVKKVASDCIPRRIGNYLKVLPTIRGKVKGPYSPYNPETCSTAIVVQSLSGVEKAVDMSKVQFVNMRQGVKAVVKKITWRGADETKQIKMGYQIRCTGDFLNWLEGDSITLEWKAADGTDATATITSIIAEDSDVDTIMLEWPHALDDVPVGTEVTFTFSLRGGVADAEPNPSKVTVTVLSGDEPTPTGDEPVVTSGHSSGYSDPGMIDPNADFIMEGRNLAGASVKVDWTDEGGNARTQTIPAGSTLAEDESITLQQGDWLEACTTADGAVLTFTVTTSHGSTTYQATVRA